jgi:hypothetical protein
VPESDTQPDAPARATIHPSIAWPLIFGLALLIAGWLYAYAGADRFEPWWLLAAAPLLAWLGQFAARAHWPDVDYGVGHSRSGVWLARVAGTAGGVWLWWSGQVTPAVAAPLLGLGLLPLWAWFAVLSWTAPRRAAAVVEREEVGRQVQQNRTWSTILEAAGLKDVIITQTREHRAGMVLHLEPAPDAAKIVTYDDVAGSVKAIGARAATHYKQTTGRRLPKGAVRSEPGEDDAEYLLHVTLRDVFAESTTFVPDYTPGDITKAIDIGEYEDASRLLLLMVGHMKIVGATGFGKSVLANNLIGRITGCSNALVWVAATDKLVPLVWPWLRPFFEGKTDRPVLDYVRGQRAHDVLVVLRDAYKLACDRNEGLDDESKVRPTRDKPAVFVFVEEVSHSVEFVDTIPTHDGQDVTISDLIKMITANGRSANVWLIMMSQFGINAALGDRASEAIRNITMRICLRTLESHDGSRTLPALPASVDTNALTNYTMYVQPNIDEPRAFPAKAAKLDGAEDVEPVAINNTRWRPAGVEPEIDLGEDYRHRWDADRLPVLARPVAKRGWTWPTVGGVAVVERPAPRPTPRREGGSPTVGGPDDGEGHGVDTTAWSDEDEAAFRALLGKGGTGGDPADERDDPDEPGRPPAAGPLPPDVVEGFDRMRRIADDVIRNPPDPGTGTGPNLVEEDGPDPGEGVPEPLASIVRWVAAEESASGTRCPPDFEVPSDTLAQAIGYSGGPLAFGRALGSVMTRHGYGSKNVVRRWDPAQRKGYRVADLLAAAEAYRTGRPGTG